MWNTKLHMARQSIAACFDSCGLPLIDLCRATSLERLTTPCSPLFQLQLLLAPRGSQIDLLLVGCAPSGSSPLDGSRFFCGHLLRRDLPSAAPRRLPPPPLLLLPHTFESSTALERHSPLLLLSGRHSSLRTTGSKDIS